MNKHTTVAVRSMFNASVSKKPAMLLAKNAGERPKRNAAKLPATQFLRVFPIKYTGNTHRDAKRALKKKHHFSRLKKYFPMNK